MKLSIFDQIKIAGIGLLIFLSMPLVFAESAPVYDADNLTQQFEASSEPPLPDIPPPSAASVEQEEGFVPMETQAAASPPKSTRPPLDERPMFETRNLTVEQRVRRIEQQINNLQASDTSAKMDSLQTQVQLLRAQLEQLSHQIEQRNRQTTSERNVETAKRVSFNSNQASSNKKPLGVEEPNTEFEPTDPLIPSDKIPSNKLSQKDANKVDSSTKLVSKVTPLEEQPNAVEEQQIYQNAYNLIKDKKYDEAINVLQGMLQKYPSGQFASNAHYWLGELYGLIGKNDQALLQFNSVVKNYPSSPRMGDAQLKVGLIYASQSKWVEAKSFFRKVINHYPGTTSARLASEQLKQIKQAGH